jgi:rRNA maturation protein Rpf1
VTLSIAIVSNSALLFNKITLFILHGHQNHHYINFAGDVKKAAKHLHSTNKHMVAEKHLITAVKYTELSLQHFPQIEYDTRTKYNHKYNIKLTEAEIHVNDITILMPRTK